MARVTIEDCIDKLDNRFELVMVAAQRARKIGSGSPLTIERDNDKNPVVSLREIADETVSIDEYKEELVRNHQRIIESDDEDDEVIDLMEGEEEWNAIVSRNADADMDNDDNDEDDSEPSLEDLAGISAEEE